LRFFTVVTDQARSHQEPCRSCGEETAIGSVFFFDRQAVGSPDGPRAYLCSACVARLRASGISESSAKVQDVWNLMAIGLLTSLPGYLSPTYGTIVLATRHGR
jgi:hypothetical protein